MKLTNRTFQQTEKTQRPKGYLQYVQYEKAIFDILFTLIKT